MTNIIERLRQERTQRWLKEWKQGLASCLNCDYDYSDLEAIVLNEEKSCPNCKKPERKKYYYPK